MTKHPQTAANTRYAFASIAAMLVALLPFVVVVLLPLGLTADTQMGLIRLSLCAVVLFTVLGGIFSVRVVYLHKKDGV